MTNTTPVHKGYTLDTLKSAFEAVQDEQDWREAIGATILLADLDVTAAAIEFYTATTMQVVAKVGDMALIYADGYRAGPARP